MIMYILIKNIIVCLYLRGIIINFKQKFIKFSKKNINFFFFLW